MILGDRREEVIQNIRRAAQNGEFNIKVELNDPVLTSEQSAEIIQRYLSNHNTLKYEVKSFCARQTANAVTWGINRHTEIVGIENACGITGGAFVTSNHFSPIDNTVIRHFIKKIGKKRINIVSQETNLAMTGAMGFLMNYADIIPIANSFHYMQRDFVKILTELLEKDEYILIYPEQEMWFNYRKPRPLKHGAYYYAAKLNAPIISCFVEMQNLDEEDTDGFCKVKYIVHVLPALYPDPEKSIKANSLEMCEKDYEQKKVAYEKAYGKPLDYTFDETDIAGWMGKK